MYEWLKYNTDWLARDVPEQGIGLSAGFRIIPGGLARMQHMRCKAYWRRAIINWPGVQFFYYTNYHNEPKPTVVSFTKSPPMDLFITLETSMKQRSL